MGLSHNHKVGHEMMNYTPEHAAQALEIVERLLPGVTPHLEYSELVRILRDPKLWKEGHDIFTKIRVNITLPDERRHAHGLNVTFAFVAECAAKTIYNCSGEDAPFDDDSFEWLLRNEKEFMKEQHQGN
jgi:hypothetical protein